MDLNDEGAVAAAKAMMRVYWHPDVLGWDDITDSDRAKWTAEARAAITAYLRAVPESDERQAWRVLRCPKCGSRNTECQARPHVHRCLDCGYDGTATAREGE